MTKQTYNRRTPDQIVADLEAKIAAVKNREVRKQAKANPAVKHGMIAIKSIDKAAGETIDSAALSALDGARRRTDGAGRRWTRGSRARGWW
jgi:hypothetical protein